MRIIAGQWRGRTLAAPIGSDTRPTSDRVREALFSSLHSRIGSLVDLRVLDAFAGSGALGFEALSRGAARVVAVECKRAALNVIAANRDALLPPDTREQEQYHLYAGDTFRCVNRLAQLGPYDLVFLDPPYATCPATIRTLLEQLVATAALAVGSVVVIERDARLTRDDVECGLWPLGFGQTDSKTKGNTSLHFAVFEMAH